MIIIIGFNKTGTSSFQELFTKLGYESHHFFWNENRLNTILLSDIIKHQKRNGRPLLGFITPERYERICLTQMDACFSPETNYWPQIVDFQRLYEENPQAIFILNKRNPQTLLQSFKNWRPNWTPTKGLSLYERIFMYNPEFFEPYQHLPTQEEQFVQFAQAHYDRVEAYFQTKPEAKFIIYDIEKDTLEKLAAHIDLKGLTQFPRVHPN